MVSRFQKKKAGRFFIIDSTPLSVSHIKRARNGKVFATKAEFGYSTIEEKFFGLKMHFIVNHKGEMANCIVGKGNRHDVKFANRLSFGLKGYLCGDKAYISHNLFSRLAKKNLKLLTKTRKTMKYKNIFHGKEKHLITHRSIVESVFNKLKNVFSLVTHRCRSYLGFKAHWMSAVIAYTFDTRKPKISMI